MRGAHRMPAAVAVRCALVCMWACMLACSAQPPAARDAAPLPLADVQADAEQGRAIFSDRSAGNCVLCHRVAGLDVPFQGDVGPDLTAVGERLSPAQLRFRIVDASRLNPATVMPPYFRTEGLSRVAPEYAGRTVLSGAEVEHLVAYLVALRGSPP